MLDLWERLSQYTNVETVPVETVPVETVPVETVPRELTCLRESVDKYVVDLEIGVQGGIVSCHDSRRCTDSTLKLQRDMNW